MTALNYTSTAGDPALDAAFERALATARRTRRWWGPKTTSWPRLVKYSVACSMPERTCGGLEGATTAIVAPSHSADGWTLTRRP